MKMIYSNTAHDAYHRVLAELRSRLGEGGEHVVIVPDKFTASSERGIIATLGEEALFNVRVTSFYAALTSVRNSGLTPESLRTAALRAPSNIKGKLTDMALIYECYIAALGDRHSDSTTRLEAFAALLAEGEPVPAHFYVVDFYDFKSPELDILCGLAKSALSLTVGMVGGKGNPNERIYCDGAAQRLLTACGGGEERHYRETLHPALDAISRTLFSYELPEERVENGGKVRLISAKSRTEEIEFLAREIVTKVADGARYRDFEVVLSDVEGYKAEVKSVFLRYGIPFFIDTRELLSEQTKTRCLLAALAAARSGLRRQEVTEFIKNPLFAGGFAESEDEVFRFENYCLRYNISYGRFLEPRREGAQGAAKRALTLPFQGGDGDGGLRLPHGKIPRVIGDRVAGACGETHRNQPLLRKMCRSSGRKDKIAA